MSNPLKLGILARAEKNRGLGIQTREYAAHLDPERVLVVDVGEHEQYPIYPEDFANATVVKMAPDGTLPERIVRKWLHGLDVVLSVETMYDWRLCDWARSQGVRTAVHANAEFYRHGIYRLPHPDGWWAPTTWRLEHLPAGTRYVPVPVAVERFHPATRGRQRRPVRFLHPVGKWAGFDRNGTETFVRACHLISRGEALDATITCLHPLPHECAPGGDWVRVEVGGVENYWDAYDGYDVVVLPRRYGGLNLATQEAMAAGLAVVMPDVSPNMDWPVVPVPARLAGRMPMPAGQVPLAEVDASQLAEVMRRLMGSPREVAEWRERSLAWAAEHSWEKLTPLYMDELQRVIDDPLPPPVPAHDPFAAQPRTPRAQRAVVVSEQARTRRAAVASEPEPAVRRPRVGER